MATKEIHIRLPLETYERLSHFMKQERFGTNSKAVTYILDQFFQQEIPVVVTDMQRTMEENATIKTQELHIQSLQQEIDTYKDQMKVKDQQIMGLVAVQGQLSSNFQQLSDRIPEKKKSLWTRLLN